MCHMGLQKNNGKITAKNFIISRTAKRKKYSAYRLLDETPAFDYY